MNARRSYFTNSVIGKGNVGWLTETRELWQRQRVGKGLSSGRSRCDRAQLRDVPMDAAVLSGSLVVH